MRSVTSRRTAPAFLWVVGLPLLLIVAGCSSSDDEGEGGTYTEGESPVEPMTPRDPVAGEPTMVPPSGGVQEEDFGDIRARQEALKNRRQVVAQSYVDLGRRYQADGRLNEALTAFGNALKTDPTNAEAQRLYSATAGVLGVPGQATYAEGAHTWDVQQARMQQAVIMGREYIRQGHAHTEMGNHTSAIESYEKALLILEANPTVDADFDRAQVEAALAAARGRAESASRQAEADRLREVEAINRERDDEERREIEQRVRRLWDLATSLFERERFAECEERCDQILRIDYSYQPAVRLKAVASIARHDKRNATNVSEYRAKWQDALQEVKDLAMPLSDVVSFPPLKRWEEISARPHLSFRAAEELSEVDMDVERRLAGTMLSRADWTEKTLDEAIRFLRNNTGVNIVVMKAVDEFMPPEERILTFDLRDITALNALRLALRQLELAYVIEDGIVKITTKEGARRRKVVEFYEVRDITARINNFPGIELNLNPSGVGAGIGGFDDDFGDEGEELRAVFEIDRLIELVRTTVDPTSWDEDPNNTISDKNGTLVVRQTPENQRQILKLLGDLRKSSGVQVQIETRFISVENNFLQDIGVDFRGLGDNSGGQGQAGLGTSSPFDDFGVPSPSLVLGTDNSAGAFYNLGGGNGDIRGRSQNLFDVGLGNPETLTGSGGFSLQFTYLDDTQVEAILRAVQKYERVNEVTAPSLVVSNTQRAHLQVTNHIAYVKDFDVEIATAAVIADPVVDVIKEGVVLDVRPIVSNDRSYVTLELRPTVATLQRPLRTFTTSLGTGSTVTFEVPELKKESLKTTVVMPDGGTLLLGGLKFYEEHDLDSGVPILKDIPIVNFFFSRKGKYTNIRNLLVLLRVKVIVLEDLQPGR